MALKGKIVLTRPRNLAGANRPEGTPLGEFSLAEWIGDYHLGILRSLLATGGAELQVDAAAEAPAPGNGGAKPPRK